MPPLPPPPALGRGPGSSGHAVGKNRSFGAARRLGTVGRQAPPHCTPACAQPGEARGVPWQAARGASCCWTVAGAAPRSAGRPPRSGAALPGRRSVGDVVAKAELGGLAQVEGVELAAHRQLRPRLELLGREAGGEGGWGVLAQGGA